MESLIAVSLGFENNMLGLSKVSCLLVSLCSQWRGRSAQGAPYPSVRPGQWLPSPSASGGEYGLDTEQAQGLHG